MILSSMVMMLLLACDCELFYVLSSIEIDGSVARDRKRAFLGGVRLSSWMVRLRAKMPVKYLKIGQMLRNNVGLMMEVKNLRSR